MSKVYVISPLTRGIDPFRYFAFVSSFFDEQMEIQNSSKPGLIKLVFVVWEN